jgi:hypothetical protein
MSDEPVILQLHSSSSAKGIEVLAITAGIGNDRYFPPEVLQESVILWDGVECYTDHISSRPGTLNHHSVRDLGGVLCDPSWDLEAQGVRATIKPTGPAAAVFVELAQASIDHPDMPVGLSADILISVDGKTVTKIVKINSLDAVTHPARGGKFVRVLQSQNGALSMTDPIVPPVIPPVVPPVDPPVSAAERNLTKLASGAKAVVESLQAQDALSKLEQNNLAAEKLQIGMCQALLQSAVAASRLPEPWQVRIHQDFEGKAFEPEDLQKRIEADRVLLSATTAGRSVQGPGGINAMFSSADYLEAATDDLLGAARRTELTKLQTNRLSGIRELYMMLTGDYDLHGGFHPERAQLATTTDFTGLVKNALNKVIAQQWDVLGAAGYNWWEQIVKVEHFDTLNDITSVLVGTVGTLPTVAEGAEYTELAVGDSPETGSFVKKGGYIPLTLELIDRDETRKLRAYPQELAFAALRSISALVAAVFTDNAHIGPTLADTGALFNATAVTTLGGHKNLLTTDLTTHDVWDATAMAMYDQPLLVKQATGYYGTGSKMAINPRFCLVSRHKWEAVRDLFVNHWSITDNKHMENLLFGEVVPICVPEWTDDDNWAAVADPRIAPAIIVGERFGIRPEIFIANRETDPAVFMNDEHRLKVRNFVAVMVSDFRPLHKSNV